MKYIEEVRQMDNEELGKFFRKIFHITTISSEELSRALYYTINCGDCPLQGSCEQTLGACNINLKAWLNSEVEE